MTEIKVTSKEVQENMKDYIVRTASEFGKPVTYVTVRMKNGFTLRESTTCVDPANYDEKIGAKICLEKIEDKVWFLLGYALQDKVCKESTNEYIPKDGDILSNEEGDFIFILKQVKDKANTSYYASYGKGSGLWISNEHILYNADGNHLENYRLATEEERELLLSNLHKAGKKWNADKKCIEDFYVPEDGDFIHVSYVGTGHEYLGICKTKNSTAYKMYFYFGLDIDKNGEFVDELFIREDCETRLATEGEKQMILSKLNELGKNWDTEEKEIVDYRRKPKWGEYYFTIGFDKTKGGFFAFRTFWNDDSNDVYNFKFGFIFQTKEQAQSIADQKNNLLKGV